MKRLFAFRLFCLVPSACLPIAAGAQIEYTGAQIEFNHEKFEGYDIYSISEVNPADSSYDFRLTIEGDNYSAKEMYDALFSQLDSVMYNLYGEKYDNKAREEAHKKLFKDLEKKQKKNERENKKLSRRLKKSLKKELKELKRPDSEALES